MNVFLSLQVDRSVAYRVYTLRAQHFSINGDYTHVVGCYVSDVDIDNWLGQAACLCLSTAKNTTYIHGVITQIHWQDTLMFSGGVVCQFASPLCCLKARLENRVWLNKSYPQVLAALLEKSP